MSFSHSPKIVTDGLVFCIDAADKNSYPGSGTTWTDLSPNGNVSTLTNGPTFSTSGSGAIYFDGNNDYVSFTSQTFAVNSSPTSFCFDAMVDDTSQTHLICMYNSYYSKCFRIIYSGHLDFETNTNEETVRGTLHTWDTNWHSYCVVFDGSGDAGSSKMYQDGVELTVGTNDALTDSVTFDKIGYGSNGSVLGVVSTVKYYNKALTPKEVLQNFNAQRSRFGV